MAVCWIIANQRWTQHQNQTSRLHLSVHYSHDAAIKRWNTEHYATFLRQNCTQHSVHSISQEQSVKLAPTCAVQ